MKPTTASLVLAGTVLAAGMAVAQDADHGEAYFSQYCATCHGSGGEGDGPMVSMMTATVPDLTTLSQRNEGAFPMLEVIHVIDGRTAVKAHGDPMPVYGAVFQKESATDTLYADVLYSRGKVLSIAYYLESIQK